MTAAYGDDPAQVADLHIPSGGGPHPVAVLLHGGFWDASADRSTMADLAADLVDRGYAVWNVEFRRVGAPGGGWPGTLADVAAALDHLPAAAADDGLDLGRIVAVGHGSGAQLALWAAAGRDAPGGAPAAPQVRPGAVVSIAGVLDLAVAARGSVGQGAVTRFLGGTPEQVPARYAAASPAALLPLGVPVLLVHGAGDTAVPASQSRDFAETAVGAGDRVELVELPAGEHDEVLDPSSVGWQAVIERLPDLLGG